MKNGTVAFSFCVYFAVLATSLAASADPVEDKVCGLESKTFRVSNETDDDKHSKEGAEIDFKVFNGDQPYWEFTDEASHTTATGYFYSGSEGCEQRLLYGVASVSDDACAHAVFLEGNEDWTTVNVQFKDLKSTCGEHLEGEAGEDGNVRPTVPIKHNGQVHWNG